jgi:hypothetical protein
MSLASSNTYIEPVAGSALNIARIDFNSSLRAVLTNFKSTARPASVNLAAGGANIGEQDGMLFRSESTNALYISDTNQVKSSRVGGNFTRVGIGNRVENGIVALGANAESYEIGELVATVSQDGGLAANARLYLCVSNTVSANSTAGFLDVGAPLGYSIGTNDNVTFSGQSVTAIRFLATSNVGINTTTPATRLHVNGDVTITDRLIRAGSVSTQIRFPAANTVSIETSAVEAMRVTPAGNVGIGLTAPLSLLHIRGTGTVVNLDTSGSEDQNGVALRFHQRDTTIVAGQGYGGIEWEGSDTGNAGVRGYIKGFAEGTAGEFGLAFATRLILETGSATEKMRITATGNVGIGITTPVERLDVNGTVRATDFNSVSDIALKEDIYVIENALNKLHKINGYKFTYKSTQKKAAGVIAQEVEKILPEAVHGEEGNKSVAYGNLIGLLIEAVKDLSNKVDILEKTKHTKL